MASSSRPGGFLWDGPAARTPVHHVMAAVQPTPFVARFDDAPDGVVVLVGHREVRITPIHPLAETDALFGDDSGELQNAIFAALIEFGDAVLLDIAFAAESELFFDFDFYPEALAIKTVLPALIEAVHGFIALVQVLVGAAPGVMNGHGVVGGDRPVNERKTLFASVRGSELLA